MIRAVKKLKHLPMFYRFLKDQTAKKEKTNLISQYVVVYSDGGICEVLSMHSILHNAVQSAVVEAQTRGFDSECDDLRIFHIERQGEWDTKIHEVWSYES